MPGQILLVSVDTLRADAIGCGGEHRLTPNLDRLAAEGESWARHYAASHWTKPSHASLLTGYPALVHGALDRDSPTAPALLTVAERFTRAGWATGALVYDCGWLTPKHGFARGFDDYRVRRWRIDKQVRAAVNWLTQHSG